MNTSVEAVRAALSIPQPPPFCGLEWRPDGRVYEPKSAYRWSAVKNELYDRAVLAAHRGMSAHGFDLTRGRVVLDLPFGVDLALLERRFGQWERVARENLARHEASAAKRAALPATEIAPTQAALKALLRAHRWAFRRPDDADRFAQETRLTAGQLRFARSLLSDAEHVVRRVEERLATEAGAEDLARARDPAVRRDVLEACRCLSSLDEDRATDANGAGWSQATSLCGHRLAEEQALTALQAAHGLRLVHRHRRQLPLALRERLYGWEPAFRPDLPPPLKRTP
ncbi:hypothetical protein [Methylobacterium ajmalii]|jgi:hypothetical protein|uniref:hypothetical protein n=1 Tax=Methylobacterium ajmalii TaxID=2738439 RepID=UPI00190B7E6F|nr:hypothetical protein [Methylobacterium ajmalii]MBK3398114.1 hypothetical protein [Methylobacterium ajmalii]MBK3406854.1 hypothetical protein [Methylobacterium ajmalii]MBK3420655.1 hypothetical protein [Methylobacterium ajmalii]MBZ6415745.1 hypothetical protein [Methylobacterium sp.]